MTAPLRLCVRRGPEKEAASPTIRVALTLPSDIDVIEETVELLALHAFAGRIPAQRTRFRFRVTLAEALANAIQCGNGGDPDQPVHVELHLTEETIRVQVTDRGTGFDTDHTTDPTDPDTLEYPCGRGLFIIRHLTDHVEFNDQGNTIWMTLPRS